MTKNEKINTTKAVARFVVGKCVSGVIVTVVHNNCPTFSKSQKVQLYVGAFVVGAMVADAARDYTDKQIDSIVEFVDNLKKDKNTK
jgi:hypothetical protein